MAEIFLKSDIVSLFKDKKVLLLGDSNVRALYKDLIWLFKCNTLIDVNFLKRRLEKNFLGDELVSRSELTCGRSFTEHRVFKSDSTSIEFIFITRCYSTQIENIFGAIKDGQQEAPDVIYMNSCLWDICRWGPNGVKEFQINMRKLMKLLSSSLPAKTLFIWGAGPPIASTTSGGLIIKQLEFIQAALRVHVMEANRFTASLVSSYGFDVLDLHHFMHYQVCRRSADGIHFLPHAMRFMTNLLLTHLALSWDVKLPRRIGVFPGPLEKVLKSANQVRTEKIEGQVQKIDEIASNIDSIVNPQESSIAADKKKEKNRRKRMRKSLRKEKIAKYSKTPLGYHKAPQHGFTAQNINDSMFPIASSSFAASSSSNSINEPFFSLDTYNNFNGYNYHPSNIVRKLPREHVPSNVWNYKNEHYYTPNLNERNQQINIPQLRCTVLNSQPTEQAQSNRHILYYHERVTVQNYDSGYRQSYERQVSNTPNYIWSDNQNTVGFGGGVMRSNANRAACRRFPYTRPDRR